MAKQSGLGWTTCNVDDDTGTPRDIKNDITNQDMSITYNPQEITGLDKFAMERLLLLADLSGTMNSVFNPSANRVHAVFAGDLRVTRTVTNVIAAQTLAAEVLFTAYNLTRAASGEFTAEHPYVLADGTTPDWA